MQFSALSAFMFPFKVLIWDLVFLGVIISPYVDWSGLLKSHCDRMCCWEWQQTGTELETQTHRSACFYIATHKVIWLVHFWWQNTVEGNIWQFETILGKWSWDSWHAGSAQLRHILLICPMWGKGGETIPGKRIFCNLFQWKTFYSDDDKVIARSRIGKHL